MYSTTNEQARRVAKELGFRPEAEFVAVMERKGAIYVRGTAGTPGEYRDLISQVAAKGYTYTGARP